MRKYALLGCSVIAIHLLGCTGKTIATNPSDSAADFDRTLRTKVVEILKRCSLTPGLEDSIYNQDIISFTVFSDGSTRDSFSYWSRNSISQPWASCVQREVSSTRFTPPSPAKDYEFKTDVDWDAVIAANPHLLTQKLKIKQAVRIHYSSLENCHLTHLKNGGHEKGRVRLQFEVVPKGTARNVRAESSDIKDKKLLGCIADVIRKIPFPKTTEVATRLITYPLVFEQ